MRIFEQLTQAAMVFGRSHSELHPYKGLKGYGPYAEPPEPFDEVALLYPREEKAAALKLSGMLVSGALPQFPGGFNKIFHSGLEFTLLELAESQNDERLPEAYLDKFTEGGRTKRLPLIVIQKTPRGSYPSVYYDTKSRFLREGIITQLVTTEVLGKQDQLGWSVFPLAMQLYSKMGGLPYVLYERFGSVGDRSVTYIVGVGISRLPGPYGAGPAFVGFALLFGPNGEWKVMKSEVKSYDRTTLANMFKNLVNGVASTIFTHYVDEAAIDRINLVIHYSGKNISGEEERALWNATSEVKSTFGKEVRFSIVKISDSAYQATIENSSCRDRMERDTGLVPVGTSFEIKPKFYMLFTVGCLSLGSQFRPNGLGSPSPILVSIKEGEGEQVFNESTLLRTVFDFCRMNYSSINNPVNRTPITITYAREIAYLMGKLGLREIPEEVASRLWFI